MIQTLFSMSELLLSYSEMKLLKHKMMLTLTARSIYEKTIVSQLSDERKDANFELINLLNDTNKILDEMKKIDDKRMSNNFRLINEIKILKQENERLNKELETIKNNLI